jgi:hypothetical protein
MRARSRSVANICCLSATPAAYGEPFLRGLSLRRLTLLLRPNILGGRCRSAGRSTMRRSVNPIRTNLGRGSRRFASNRPGPDGGAPG